MADDPTEPTPKQLQASDGHVLHAMQYLASGQPKGYLIVAGATGVPQRFYKRFAQFAAAQGLEVWTLDYRGIGLSKPESLVGFEMDYLDWARQDLAALLAHLATQGATPIWMVGHSYGGHAFGLLPGKERVQRFATFATGAGWHGWMPPLERLRVLFMWRVLGPLIVRAKGYLAWSLLGMGEDLPRGVYTQWRHWCQWPRYFFDDPAQAHLAAEFAKVDIPIRAINLEPTSLGMPAIGHMGYFRPQAQALWKDTLDWLTTDAA